jgi:hypothetical protein
MHDKGRVPVRKRRVSITKLQRQTAAGAELIALCQTVTEDGSLADNEVTALRQWLRDNQGVDLPAHDVLMRNVANIVADGKVTADERRELYRIIELVLPPDIRSVVRDRRRALERNERELAQATREAEREATLLNRPLDSWDFMVAGVRHEGRRPESMFRSANAGDPAFLVRDRDNKFSRHAVEVRLENGMQIGFVPEEDAVEIAAHLDAGRPHVASIKMIVTGGRSSIPVVAASVYDLGATRSDLIFEHQVPTKAEPPHRTPSTDPAHNSRGATGSRTAVVVMLVAAALGVTMVVYSMLRRH